MGSRHRYCDLGVRNRGQEYVNHSPKVSSWEGAEARSQVAPDSGSVHLLPGSRLQLLNDLCHPPPNAPFSHPQRQSLRTLEILPGAPPILSAEFKVLSLGVKALSDRTSGASRAPSFPVLPSRLQLFPDLPRLSFASRPLRTFCCREHGCPVLPCSDSPSGARTQACSTLGVPSHPPRVAELAPALSHLLLSGVSSLSGRASPLRAEMGSLDPQHWTHQGLWLISATWVKTGLPNPGSLSCPGCRLCVAVCQGLQKTMGSWRKKKYAPKLKAPTVRGPVEDSALMEYQPSYPPSLQR